MFLTSGIFFSRQSRCAALLITSVIFCQLLFCFGLCRSESGTWRLITCCLLFMKNDSATKISRETSLRRNFRFSIKKQNIFSRPLKVLISINLHSFELEITDLSAILLFIFHFFVGGQVALPDSLISLSGPEVMHTHCESGKQLLSLSPAAFLLCQQSSESFSHSVWAPYKQTIDSATKKDRGKERKRREK